MNIIKILNQDLEKVLEVKGEGIYIKIKDGIQCVCKGTSWSHFDSEMIIYTVPRNFFLIQKQENENEN